MLTDLEIINPDPEKRMPDGRYVGGWRAKYNGEPYGESVAMESPEDWDSTLSVMLEDVAELIRYKAHEADHDNNSELIRQA